MCVQHPPHYFVPIGLPTREVDSNWLIANMTRIFQALATFQRCLVLRYRNSKRWVTHWNTLIRHYYLSPSYFYCIFSIFNTIISRLCTEQVFKGTVSRDWDVLVVVWMDRALFGDEPLTGFITICCFLVFNFVFYFLQRYCTKVASLCVFGTTLLQIYNRLLATLRQICSRG